MLTSWLSWRWVLFVNVPIGVLLAVLAPRYITESERQPGRFDLAGALTSTAGMTALVYGFISPAQDSWTDPTTLGSFTAAAMFGMFFFLTLFVQDVLGYSPLRAGLSFLPVTATIIVSSQIAARSLPRVGPRRLMTAGAVLALTGLAWL